MNRILTKRLALGLITFAVVCLAAAVFLWGTEYKVSLYPHGYKSRPAVPSAKLLSERERPASVTQAVEPADTLALAAFFSLTLLTLALREEETELFPSDILRRRTVASIRRTPCLFHFSFRPPPRLAV